MKTSERQTFDIHGDEIIHDNFMGSNKSRQHSTEIYEDYFYDTTGNMPFQKQWPGGMGPVMYADPVVHQNGGGPILMMAPNGDFRMVIILPLP